MTNESLHPSESQRPIEAGQPVRFSRLVPKEVLKQFAENNRLDLAGEYHVVAIVRSEDTAWDAAVIEPVPKIMAPGEPLEAGFSAYKLRKFLEGDKEFDHLRQVPVEYLERAPLN